MTQIAQRTLESARKREHLPIETLQFIAEMFGGCRSLNDVSAAKARAWLKIASFYDAMVVENRAAQVVFEGVDNQLEELSPLACDGSPPNGNIPNERLDEGLAVTHWISAASQEIDDNMRLNSLKVCEKLLSSNNLSLEMKVEIRNIRTRLKKAKSMYDPSLADVAMAPLWRILAEHSDEPNSNIDQPKLSAKPKARAKRKSKNIIRVSNPDELNAEAYRLFKAMLTFPLGIRIPFDDLRTKDETAFRGETDNASIPSRLYGLKNRLPLEIYQFIVHSKDKAFTWKKKPEA